LLGVNGLRDAARFLDLRILLLATSYSQLIAVLEAIFKQEVFGQLLIQLRIQYHRQATMQEVTP